MQPVQKTGEIPQVLFLDTVVLPVVVQRLCLGYVSTENCGVSAVAVLTWWSMPLFMQFIDGYGRPCNPAATLGLPLEVPQTQFIASAGGHSSCRDRGLSARAWRR